MLLGWVSLLGLLAFTQGYSDFVASVDCEAEGMGIVLKETLPTPRSGMWDLEVEGFPDCPAVTKTDVGGGHRFLIPFREKELCGVDAEYLMTPKRLAQARTILLLKDDNGTIIADSVSCVYKTKFQTSLLTYSGEVRSENLVYGGSLEEEGSDVEATVRSADAVAMDFFGPQGQPLKQRNVKLGDPLLFRIDVSEDHQVSQILPESCYFSSSSSPTEGNIGGTKVLPFVKKSCFNAKDGMVRAFLPRMERRGNGTAFEMLFPAFYFTGHGQNLFVHCTVLACVGTEQDLCSPHPNCFSSSDERRKRRSVGAEGPREGKVDEVLMTKYIIVQDSRAHKDSLVRGRSSPCVPVVWAVVAAAAGGVLLVALCAALGVVAGKLSRKSQQAKWAEQRLMYAGALAAHPPAYHHASAMTLTKPQPSLTSF